ncbi:hypothetical protein G7054_g2182 [Neopestalotiopsis clavispora]|nr:hypothetical protein G7054_g2182 [Neopestalotiopsis clavispora]
MAESVEKFDIVDRLAARSCTQELNPIRVADDWRADEARDRRDHCATCRWNGHWDDIGFPLNDFDIAPRRDWGNPKPTIDLLEQSVSKGNLCCGVLLALIRKFHATSVWSNNRQDGGLLYKATINVPQIYLYHDKNNVDTPPGATLYSQGRHPHMDPRSDEALSWAQRHIHDCVKTHDCSSIQFKTQSLPTRLIYIPENVSNGCIRLVVDTTSLPPNTHYTALTHCWGKIEPQCLTTVENINTYSTAGIPWGIMPQTFRDAMQYTRRLGLEYIWIDSICVIQKNAMDWQKESTRMFEYYSNAHVTLGSIFGADGTSGFFSERHIQASTLYLFDIIFKGTNLGVYARRSVNEERELNTRDSTPTLPWSDVHPYPLFKRAWTFQERLVSPRLLLFTEYELFLECYARRNFKNSYKLRHKEARLKEEYKLLLSDEQDLDRPGEWTWEHLVESFAALQLTVPTDKLPAFAAVAQQYLSYQILPHPPEEEYLCGLRKSHLHYDLFWFADQLLQDDAEDEDDQDDVEDEDDQDDVEDEDEARGTRPSKYLAPSWSWASVPRVAGADINPLRHQQERSTIALMGECLTFTKAGRFGRVLGGYITIRGPVLDCMLPPTWHRGDDLVCEAGCGQELRLQDGRKFFLFDFEPDFPRGYKELEANDRSASEVVISLLQIWASDEGSGYLALLKNMESQRYYRLGAGWYKYSQFETDALEEQFQNAEERTLELE